MRTRLASVLKAFAFMCLLIPSVVGRTDICVDSIIQGIFNIGDHLFIQFRGLNPEDWKHEELIRFNETYSTNASRPGLLQKTLFKKAVDSRPILDKMKPSIYPDFPVFGYHLNIDEDMATKCLKPTNDTDKKWCQELHLVFHDSDKEIVCFYGHKDQTNTSGYAVGVWKYSKRMNTIDNITDEGLRDHLNEKCHLSYSFHNSPSAVIDSGVVYNYFDQTDQIHYERRLFRFTDFDGEWLVAIDDKSVPGHFYTQKLDGLEYNPYYLFRFNDFYGTFGCPQPCNMDTSLMSIVFDDPGPKFTIRPTSYTLNTMLRCNEETKEIFTPMEFCEQMTYDSVLRLGADYYFQKNGQFWRYSTSYFTNKYSDTPDKTIHYKNLVFDADITQFLEKENFDVFQPIHGFTFKARLPGMCGPVTDEALYFHSDHSCDAFYKNPDYWVTCIYGKTMNHIPENNGWSHTDVYFYTPNGLRIYRDEKHRNDHKEDICSKVWNHLSVESFGDSINKLVAVTSFSTEPPPEEPTNQIYAITYDKTNYQVLYDKVINWTFESNEPQYKNNMRSIERSKLDILWVIFHPNDRFFSQKRNSPLMYMSETANMLEFKVILDTPEPDPTLQDLFTSECPIRQFDTYVMTHKEKPCDDKWTDAKKTSAFNIGKVPYIQMNQQFFKYVVTDGKTTGYLAYDRYVTNQINKYFDTTVRVRGYSVLNGTKGLVIIFGKANNAFKDEFTATGTHIFALFELRGISNIIPIMSPKSDDFPDLDLKPPYVTLGLNSGGDVLQNFDISVVPNLDAFVVYNTFFAFVLNMGGNGPLYQTIHSNNRTFFPFNGKFSLSEWTQREQKNTSYRTLFGFFHTTIVPPGYELEHSNIFALVDPTGHHTPSPLFVYLQAFEDTNKYELKDLVNFKPYLSFTEFFCRIRKAVPQNTRNENSKMFVVLSIFLIILLFVTLIVAFIAYTTSKTSGNSDQIEKNPSNEKKKSDLENKSNIEKK